MCRLKLQNCTLHLLIIALNFILCSSTWKVELLKTKFSAFCFVQFYLESRNEREQSWFLTRNQEYYVYLDLNELDNL